MRVGLIACSAGKLDGAAPARELYSGPIFQLAKAWMERRVAGGGVQEWAILSARHGLVMPDQMIARYDLALADMTAAERGEWADRTRQQLLDRWGESCIYQVLAGEYYRAALSGLPMVEDVLGYWTRRRREDGIKPAHMSIGIMKRYLVEDRPYGV